MSKVKIISWKEDNKYSLVTGGLLYTILTKLNIIQKKRRGLIKTAIILTSIAWIPLVIITIAEGTFVGDKVDINFLTDVLSHTLYLIVIPFLILIEKILDSSYDNYVNSTRRIVSVDDEQKFVSITNRIAQLSNSFYPEIIILALIYLSVIFLQATTKPDIVEWNYVINDNETIDFTLGGWYLLLISGPIYQLLVVRWLFRWLLWVYSAFRFSRLELTINSSHADQMAGMEYLNIVPLSFGLVFLSLSTVLSATIFMEILFHSAILTDYLYTILGFVVLITFILYLPLLFFTPLLIRAKIEGINYFGSLIQYHNNLYNKKWMEGDLPNDEPILGSLDNSSMADINGAYQQSISGMSTIPINLKWMVGVVLLLIIPFIPLIATMYSFIEVISTLKLIFLG